MATAQEYPNSDASQSGKNRDFLRREELPQLIARLDIPHTYRRSFATWWELCGSPDGRTIEFWKGQEEFARKAQICVRTARNHYRAFERFQLVEIAHKANSKFRPPVYRVKNETLQRNRWPECKRCGHKHQSDQECGCDMGPRRGRFHTKEGVISKTIPHRICRCKPPRQAPVVPIRRPSRSSHSSPSPAQEPSSATSPATPASVREAPPVRGTRSEQRLQELRRGLARDVTLLLKEGKSREEAIRKVCMKWGVTADEAQEHLKLMRFEAPPAPAPRAVSTLPPGEVLPPEHDPWRKILRALKAKINPHAFETWLAPTRFNHEIAGVLFVRVPTAEFRVIELKYADLIREAIASLGLEVADVKFVCEEA